MTPWREQLDSLEEEQKNMLLGSSLSQRCAAWPLSLSHPAIVGAFFGLLLMIALILPIGLRSDWVAKTWFTDTAFMTLTTCLFLAILGQISSLTNRIIQRPPIAPPRVILFSLPFIGLAGLIGLWMNIIPEFPEIIAWIILLIPGPIYVHLSWAPRYRMLILLEDGKNPFEPHVEEVGEREKELELEAAVEALAE